MQQYWINSFVLAYLNSGKMATSPSFVSFEGLLSKQMIMANHRTLINPSVKRAMQLSLQRTATQKSYASIFDRNIHNFMLNWWRLVKRNSGYQQVKLLIRHLKIFMNKTQQQLVRAQGINKEHYLLFGKDMLPMYTVEKAGCKQMLNK